MSNKLSIQCSPGLEPFMNTLTGKLECVQVCVPPAIPQGTRDGSRVCVTLIPPPHSPPQAASVQPVPTLAEWAMVMLVVLLTAIAAVAARGRM